MQSVLLGLVFGIIIEELSILNYTLERLKTDLNTHICGAEGAAEAFFILFRQKIQKYQFYASMVQKDRFSNHPPLLLQP